MVQESAFFGSKMEGSTVMDQYRGFSSAEAKEILEKVGPNSLPVPGHRLAKLVLRQFKGIFNLLLLVAAGITFALQEPIDGCFILFFVFLGTGLNVYQEYKSNAAADKLKEYLLRTITTRRDGEDQEISTEEIVPGDIIKLESGDIVPADSVILELRNLLADETTFTGESIPAAKDPGEELLQGVVIVRGNAVARVTATGKKTKLAGISASASAVQSASELVKGIDRISKFILKLTTYTLVLVVIANLFIDGRGTDVTQLIIFALALAVSVIPEALPLVLTFSLSRGALRFAKGGVIVKRLASVQDLGSINLLCTDKTGTLTENRLAFANELPMPDSAYEPLLLARLAAIGLKERIPEPFDRASEEALSPLQREQVRGYKLVEEEAFDPILRSNGAFLVCNTGATLHVRRGSPEYFVGQGLIGKEEFSDWICKEELLGHRVLGVSYDEGGGIQFGGFVSFVDTLKETTAETVRAARNLHVDITIITGDARIVAEAVGRQAGLVTESAEVVEASEFFQLSDQEQVERAGQIRVFARTTPEQKLALIQLLKRDHTVGYLGEGINDAPALKAAHVSMVVQSAADVARETADIVLLKSDLRVIVEGIRLGRETHANTMKYIRATLVSNFGNFYAVAIGSLMISFLPMLPKQLLLLNLLSDFPMMAIAFDRVPAKELTQPQKYDFRSLYITFVTLGLVSTVFDFIYFGLFFRISPEVLQTNWFIASVITELLLIFSIRSIYPIEKSGWPAPIVVGLSAAAIGITLALVFLPQTAEFFEFSTPTLAHLGIIGALAMLYLVATEIVKRPLAHFLRR